MGFRDSKKCEWWRKVLNELDHQLELLGSTTHKLLFARKLKIKASAVEPISGISWAGDGMVNVPVCKTAVVDTHVEVRIFPCPP
jgi:hypothetical protein